MSGHSSTTACPNCGNEAMLYSDYKPVDIVVVECLHCGFHTYTEFKYCNLEELNSLRESFDMEPLEALPEQIFR